MAKPVKSDRPPAPRTRPWPVDPPLDTSLYEQFEESVAIYLRDATCVYLNRVTEEIFAKSRAEVIGRVLWDVFPEARGNPFYQAFRRVAETGRSEELVHHYEPWDRWFDNRFFASGPYVYVFGREITGEQRVREALKLHERILESMVEGVSLADEHGVIVYTNPAEDRMFGYSPGELIGKHVTVQNAYPPDENARIVREVMAKVRAEGSWEGDLANVRRDGTSFVTRARINAMELGGKPHWVCVRSDVTEKLRAQEGNARLQKVTAALSRSVTPKEVATAAIEQGVTVLAADTGGLWLVSEEENVAELVVARGYTEESSNHLRRLSLSSGSAIPILDAILTREPVWIENRERFRGQYAELEAALEVQPTDYGFACLPLNVQQRCIGGIAFTFGPRHSFDEGERVLLMVLARQCALALERARLYEQTQRSQQTAAYLAQASEVLAASLDYERTLEALTQLVIPTLADWCVVDMVRPDGEVRHLAVAHQDPEKVRIARQYQERYPVDLSASWGIGKVLRSGQSELVVDVSDELLAAANFSPERLRTIRELGIRSYISVPLKNRGKILGGLTLVYAESGRRYSTGDLQMAEDLARRAAVAVDNALLYREAQDAIRLRDEFLSVASHELKNPLTSLRLQVELLERSLRSGAFDQGSSRLASTRRQLGRFSSLIESLLDVSRIGAGRFSLSPEDVDLTAVVREVVSRYELSEGPTRSRISAELEEVRGRWDRLRIEQVVTNLVDNAVKYGAGKPVHVRLHADASSVTLVVRDHGIGIAPDYLPRLFGRFERGVSDRQYSGLGLGLYITKTIVEAMGGGIRVESEPGKGATFTVVLPRRG